MSYAKTTEPIEKPFRADSCGSKEPCTGSRCPLKGAFWGDVYRPMVTYLHMSALRTVRLFWNNGRMHSPTWGVTRWRDGASCQITLNTCSTVLLWTARIIPAISCLLNIPHWNIVEGARCCQCFFWKSWGLPLISYPSPLSPPSVYHPTPSWAGWRWELGAEPPIPLTLSPGCCDVVIWLQSPRGWKNCERRKRRRRRNCARRKRSASSGTCKSRMTGTCTSG